MQDKFKGGTKFMLYPHLFVAGNPYVELYVVKVFPVANYGGD